MAGNLIMGYDRLNVGPSSYKFLAVNFNVATQIDGIYFDGRYHWMLQDQNLLMVEFQGNFSPKLLKTIDVSNVIGNAGTSTPTAIVGDGRDFYVAFTYATGAGPLIQKHQIVKLGRDGGLKKLFPSTELTAPATTFQDLAYDGRRIYANYDLNAADEILVLDVQNDVSTLHARTFTTNALDYDGRNFNIFQFKTHIIMGRDFNDKKTFGDAARAPLGATTDGRMLWLVSAL